MSKQANKRLYSFRLDEELMENVKKLADSRGESATTLVTIALETLVKEQLRNGEVTDKAGALAESVKLDNNNVNILRNLLVDLILDRELTRQKSHKDEIQELKEQFSDVIKTIESLRHLNQQNSEEISNYS